ncbi:MAG: DUF2007 domain-containing protein [Bacteroidetes bacterium]|nr:MAG: DUF2007 domain-containing protein [Bacteroidota bacterium]
MSITISLVLFQRMMIWNDLWAHFIKLIEMKKHDHDETLLLEVFDDLGTATTVQAQLKDQGIESFIHDNNVLGMDPIAGIEIRIFSKDLKRAKQVLSMHNDDQESL